MSDAAFNAGDATTPAATTLVYAGFWRRAIASVIDGLIFFVPFFIAFLLLFPEYFTLDGPPPPDARFVAYQAIGLIAGTAYKVGFEGSRYQATVGKYIIKLKVTDLDGARVSYATAFKRAWFQWLPGVAALVDTLMGIQVLQWVATVAFIVSCLFVPFTMQKQALHDKTAGCLVLRRA